MCQPAYSIFIDTTVEGRVPLYHDRGGRPVVYPTRHAAEREIADDTITRLQEFLDGQRSFDDAMTVEAYILDVDVLEDGSVVDADGNHFTQLAR
jgi:hypothetical protein